MNKSVVMLGTFDTKAVEFSALRAKLTGHGLNVISIDCGIMPSKADFPVEYEAEAVALASGYTLEEMRNRGDRGEAEQLHGTVSREQAGGYSTAPGRQSAVHFAHQSTFRQPEMTAPDTPSLPRFDDDRRPVLLMEPGLLPLFRDVEGPFRMLSHVGWGELHDALRQSPPGSTGPACRHHTVRRWRSCAA